MRRRAALQAPLPGLAPTSEATLQAERLGRTWAEELAHVHPLVGDLPALPVDAASVIAAGMGPGLAPGEALALALAAHRAAGRRRRELGDAAAARLPGARR